MSSPVFFDPSGRRRRVASRLAMGVGLVVAVASTIFGLSLTTLAKVESPSKKARTFIPNLPRYDQQKAAASLQSTKKSLREAMAGERKTAKPKTPSDKIVLGYFAPWQQSGLESLRAHAAKMTHLAPAWLSLNENADGLSTTDFDLASNPANKEVLEICRQNGLRVVPILSNSKRDDFDPEIAKTLLSDSKRQDKLIQEIVSFLDQNRFDGINIDFELVPENLWSNYVSFLDKLRSQLAPKKYELSIDLEAGIEPKVAAQAVEQTDWSVVMLYDEHGSTDSPGAIASLPWTGQTLSNLLQELPEDKVVMGIGNYAYDWKKKGGSAQALTFEDAMATAAEYRDSEPPSDVINVDDESVNPRFEYEDDDGKPHVVWMLDAITAYNQWRLGQDAGLRGAALWVLGAEDPAIWSFLDRQTIANEPRIDGLDDIHFPYEVDFVGRGEILSVKARPQDGVRKVELSPDSGEVMDWTYEKLAFPFVLQKRGYQPKTLVLTFDDGPDPKYTPVILDKLKALGVHATFFILGQNAVSHPDLVQRIYDEGHEVASHSYTHPNMGAVSENRAKLELNATRRAIEAIIGRSTTLFRPPYNADSQPQTREQVTPIEVADQLHYITVGENVDPLDWDLRQVDPDGTVRVKNGRDIAAAVVNDIDRRKGTDDEGNIILLHDAGGDRSATIQSLDILVPELKKRGYKFGLVADLLGKTRAEIMPPIPADQLTLVGIDRVVFTVSYWVDRILTIGFISAIFLGIGRAILIAILAGISTRKKLAPLVGSRPTVSALIAAYNEETVIGSTIRSVLASHYPVIEILVVDDGSSDGTSQRVAEEFKNEPRVRLITKENGGKASALNMGIEQATGEVLFCIDADTELDPSAIGFLAEHFGDPKVAAVAGNVKVGNAQNLITRWQALEYTSSQNVDRRAYGLLNCITVVPGAIGAWRASAVREVGGYKTDTLAEDMDLTWRLRRQGHLLINDPRAKAYTEAPESFGTFFKQRFRWAYGTLQCLVKHSGALGRYGWFGRFALPSLWILQVVYQILAPIMDLKMILLLVSVAIQIASGGGSMELDSSQSVFAQLAAFGKLYGIFFAIELIAAWFAYTWDNARKSDLWFLFLQRFVYRQMMYGVVLKSLWRAVTGGRQGWGKLQRTGNVKSGS